MKRAFNRIWRLIVAFAIILAASGEVSAIDLTGQASIIDGDTIEIHGTRIRLWGVDAPESSKLCRGEDSLQYRCGTKAANDLDAFINGRLVNCVPISLDRYGRTVASCAAGEIDLADWLIRNGLALDWPQSVKLSARLSMLDADCGRAGMSRLGCIELASA
ncbi:endonuclease YncB(thermonuclease family) [Bradyrhizobium yuanmingense]|uniref:thermonuclease family protein n=1 Tax=Bradyrhizobium yuanmingense TaxID=108015 RepID=UPI0035123C7A